MKKIIYSSKASTLSRRLFKKNTIRKYFFFFFNYNINPPLMRLPQTATRLCCWVRNFSSCQKKTDVPAVIRDFSYHLNVLPHHQVSKATQAEKCILIRCSWQQYPGYGINLFQGRDSNCPLSPLNPPQANYNSIKITQNPPIPWDRSLFLAG